MTKAINLGKKSGGSFDPKGTYEELIAGDLVSLNDRVTVAGKFVIRTAAGEESIENGRMPCCLKSLAAVAVSKARLSRSTRCVGTVRTNSTLRHGQPVRRAAT